MDALFDRIAEESDPRVKAVVALFLFKYIHPFPDANGRTGRFLMNALMAGAGLPWTAWNKPASKRTFARWCYSSRNFRRFHLHLVR